MLGLTDNGVLAQLPTSAATHLGKADAAGEDGGRVGSDAHDRCVWPLIRPKPVPW